MRRPIPRVVEEWGRAERDLGVDETCRSFLAGAATGLPVLLVHGAGGSPEDLRHLGDFLAGRGFRALCPLLPGHGLDPGALAGIRFSDLIRKAVTAFDALSEGGPPPAVVGQSLGAVIGVQLAARRPVSRFVALAPAFRPFVVRRAGVLALLGLFRPRLAVGTFRWQAELLRGIRETRRIVPSLECPLLILQSSDDPSVSPRGAEELHRNAGSPDKRLLMLEGQGHVLSRAPDREREIYEPLVAFLRSATAEAGGTGTTGPPQPGA